ncbi:MAG: amino acid--tRNA ligase-related protein, partial [Phycisphaerae bacterium]|nr:amino acid--tRNA ligase-related protein [Phycisphaerae bacterium]
MNGIVNRTSIKDVLRDASAGSEVTVGGWVRTVRTSKGGFSFLALNDGSCLACIQIIADKDLPNYEGEIIRLSTGCSVIVTGQVKQSPGKGQRVELQAAHVRIIGWADVKSYPIQPKHHTFEFLRTQAHLRPRTNTFGAMARVRSAMAGLIHKYFQSCGYVYVHTPLITASDCEGAGQLFRVTTLNPDDTPRSRDGNVDHAQDFFGRTT